MNDGASAAALAELPQQAALLWLLLARLSPLTLLTPWLSLQRPAPALSLVLTVALSVALFPVALPLSPTLPLSPWTLSALALREALLGLVYAFALALPLSALRWAGDFMDRARAAPLVDIDDGTLSQLTLWLGVLVFFAIGGHRVALSALADALVQHPPGALSLLTDPGTLALSSARLLSEAFAAAVLVALPVLASLLLAELSLSLSMRLSGALPLSAAMPGLRAGLTLLVLWVAAGSLVYRLPPAFRSALDSAASLFRSL